MKQVIFSSFQTPSSAGRAVRLNHLSNRLNGFRYHLKTALIRRIWKTVETVYLICEGALTPGYKPGVNQRLSITRSFQLRGGFNFSLHRGIAT